MKKQEQINRLQFRIERIESHLAEQHKGNNFNLSEKPNSCEPNPCAVDWSNAPDWADSHAFDKDGEGVWYGTRKGFATWWDERGLSGFTLPSGLDWTKSKTTRP